MTELREQRIKKQLTQKEAAERIGISLRSYVMYENDPDKSSSSKYRFLVHELQNINSIDEEHGLLSVDKIKKICTEVFEKYPVDFCYLFGSYAKGTARQTSDVDLLVSTEITGLRYYELVETLRQTLHKKVDLLDITQVIDNRELLQEILKDGVKIYG